MNKIPVINQTIKDKRKELKITQTDFSKMINKSLGTVKRYDTGDIIPENTLILICEKLNLDIDFLIKEQEKQNEALHKEIYNDLITKKTRNEISEVLDNLISQNLYLIYSAFYNYPVNIINIELKNNKFYIFNDTVVIDILNDKEAKNLLKDMKEYFEFKTERLRKEKLNK